MRVKNMSRLWLASAACGLALSMGNWAFAAPVSYTIDPVRSTLVMTGDLLGLAPVIPQVAGSDSDTYSGTINADLAGGLLTFSGGSSITANLSAVAPFTPVANPGVDNYAFFTNVSLPASPPLAGTWNLAFRNIVFDITTGIAQDGVVPPASTMTLRTTSGFASIETTSSGGPFPSSFANQNAFNSTVGAVSLTQAGGIETLVIPFRRESGAGGTHFIFTGNITATRVVPEPSTMVLAGLGMIGACVAVWRKRRAS